MVPYTCIFFTGPVPTCRTRPASSSLPPWDPQNPSQQTPVNLDPCWKKRLTENLVKIAQVLDLTNDIWSELQAANVIKGEEIARKKVFI